MTTSQWSAASSELMFWCGVFRRRRRRASTSVVATSQHLDEAVLSRSFVPPRRRRRRLTRWSVTDCVSRRCILSAGAGVQPVSVYVYMACITSRRFSDTRRLWQFGEPTNSGAWPRTASTNAVNQPLYMSWRRRRDITTKERVFWQR